MRLVPLGLGLAMTLALASITVAFAQSAGAGIVVGEVARCANSSETPAPNVTIGLDGGTSNLAKTDKNGEFTLTLAPGQYTIVATADDGTTARWQYVPVSAGVTLDIGIMDLNAGLSGCGFDADVPTIALATDTPVATATPTAVPDVPTLTPTPLPTLEVPADTGDQSQPAPPPDNSDSGE
jgi:carboxypeptidase family protein